MSTTLEHSLTIEEIKVPGFEKVLVAKEPSKNFTAIIAIHDMRLGKAALGGTRIYPYNTFEEALTDVTRLAEGMTYKAAASQSGWGGGKSVIIADPKKNKTEELLKMFADFVNTLEGEYICAEDSGCSPDDIAVIAKYTPYVVGLPHEKSSGNPSPFTAWGVFRGIQAAAHHMFGSDSLRGKTVAIQGLGSVGTILSELLFWHGAKLIVTDIVQANVERIVDRFGAEGVEPGEIFDQECDIFAPCALGGIINPATIERLKCRIVAGAANNQLLTSDRDAEALRRLGILFAPDFVINAGGLINVSEELCKEGYRPFVSRNKTDKVYDQLRLIFDIAEKNRITTLQAAMRLVKYRLEYGVGKRTGTIYMHHANLRY